MSEPLSNIEDWSAAIVPDAAIDDLDTAAIAKALENYKNKFPGQAKDVDQWFRLDKTQKRKPLSDEEGKYLKGLGLIEGKKPNYVISAKITASLSNDELKAHYIKQRGLDDEHYKNLIVEYLKKFGESPRKNIEKFLRDKLPDILTESQKKNKITNLLSALRIKGAILTELRHQIPHGT